MNTTVGQRKFQRAKSAESQLWNKSSQFRNKSRDFPPIGLKACETDRPYYFRSALLIIYTDMAQGTIKKLISDKGFGFIASGGKELFFHHSSLEGVNFDDLQEGQSVDFTEGQGPKGPRAENVKPS